MNLHKRSATSPGMKLIICLVILSSIMSSAAFAAQDPAREDALENLRMDTRQFINSLENYTAEQKDDVVEKGAMALDKLDSRIEALQAEIDQQWDDMSMSAREVARASMTKLRRQRIEVAEQFGSVRSSSTTAWKSMSQGFSEAYGELYDAWQDAEAAF